MREVLVLAIRLIRELLDLVELMEAGFVALVNEMDLALIDQTLNASVSLLLLLPKVERQTVERALSALRLTWIGASCTTGFNILPGDLAHQR